MKTTQAKKQNNNTSVCRINARLTPTEANKLIKLTENRETTVSNVVRDLIMNAR